MTAGAMRDRSKTLATWLAVLGGALGMHRFYLRGLRDPWGWSYWPPTLLGLAGVQRMRAFGQDDRIAWLLIPLLGLAISAAMLSAIVYGLTPDETWDARHNPGRSVRRTGWLPVLGVITALLVGATVLMGTIAFAGQRFFEWRLRPAPAAAAAPGPTRVCSLARPPRDGVRASFGPAGAQKSTRPA